VRVSGAAAASEALTHRDSGLVSVSRWLHQMRLVGGVVILIEVRELRASSQHGDSEQVCECEDFIMENTGCGTAEKSGNEPW